MEYIPPANDDSSGGAVSRPIRVTVRTIGGRHPDVERNSASTYHDAISIVNLNRFFRHYGVPVPRSICTHLWMVRDCAGWVGAVFTWFLIVGGELLVMLALAAQQFTFFTLLNGVLQLSCAALGIISHLRAMFTDPVTFVCTFGEILLSWRMFSYLSILSRVLKTFLGHMYGSFSFRWWDCGAVLMADC